MMEKLERGLEVVMRKKKNPILMDLQRMRVKKKTLMVKESLEVMSRDEESDDIGTSPSNKDSQETGEDNSNPFGDGGGRGKPSEIEGSVNIDPSSFTDKIFRNRESELIQDSQSGYSIDYGNMVERHTSNIVVDYKEIHELISNHYKKGLDHNKDCNQIERVLLKNLLNFDLRIKRLLSIWQRI